MKIKFNPDDYLLLVKTLETHDMIIVSRSIFNDGNKYYPHAFLNKCLYNLAESI